MGPAASLLSPVFPQDILMLGLDGAGKTTILNTLTGGAKDTVPTIGFNLQTLNFQNIKLTIWDVGGQDKIVPLWEEYFKNTSAIVFVVDSVDHDRFSRVEIELNKLFTSSRLHGATFLVLLNKSDLGVTAETVVFKRHLEHTHMTKDLGVFDCSAKKNEGLAEAFTWLTYRLKQKNPPNPLYEIYSAAYNWLLR